ncbi:MAG: sulfite exporter TauE/SafE family protein [Kiritimatiellae bacterium]|nr:sulfite exporter TauE/SafE family protein [Kiritimatiellia bacterium]
MEMTLETLWACLRLPVGGLILGLSTGLLTGLFGAGGGFIITPALNLFLGIPYNLAVGTSTCQILFASGFSLYHHLDRRISCIRIAALTGIGIPMGTYVGVRVVSHLRDMGTITVAGNTMPMQEFFFTTFFCIFLSLIAGWLLFDNFYLRRHIEHDDDHKGLLACIRIPPLVQCHTIPSGPFSAPVLMMLGFGMGFLSGLLGIGGGVIMMPLLFYVIGQETKYAALTSTMLVFGSSLFSSFFHTFNGNVHYLLAAFLICGALIGTKTGAAIQKKITARSIRKYFGFVVLIAVFMVLYKLATLLKSPGM